MENQTQPKPCKWGEGEMSKLLYNKQTGFIKHEKCPYAEQCEYFEHLLNDLTADDEDIHNVGDSFNLAIQPEDDDIYESPILEDDVWDLVVHDEGQLNNKFFMFNYELKSGEVRENPNSAFDLLMVILTEFNVKDETRRMVNEIINRNKNIDQPNNKFSKFVKELKSGEVEKFPISASYLVVSILKEFKVIKEKRLKIIGEIYNRETGDDDERPEYVITDMKLRRARYTNQM